jgi:hypothetical protein
VKKLFLEIQGRVVLVVGSGGAYAAAEWQLILDVTRRADVADLRFLVHDDGGTISSGQRAELIAGMEGRMPMAAVFTSNTISRGIVTAIGWFKPGIKAFGPEQFDEAARYLGLTPSETTLARWGLERLQRQLPRKSA